MSLYGRLSESTKGITPPASLLSAISTDNSIRTNTLADPVRISKVFSSQILEAPVPKNIEFRNRHTSFYVEQYTRAAYYFYHCSILSTVILRITQETMRNGIDWFPRFQSKCPKCLTEYPRSTKKCHVCGYEGEMMVPDVTQQQLLVNWEGKSLIDCVNKNDWSLLQLCESYLEISLTYNQPIILCKSAYITDNHENVLDEIPQEFIPISPAKAKMLYNDRGEPGNGEGFHLSDRNNSYPLNSKDILATGYHDDLRYYPCRWSISEMDGGEEGASEYYARQEIFHKVIGLQSLTYGTPFSLLVEADVRAWMAMELRIEKYYSTGHPQGIFVINNATPDTLTTVQQSIRIQMRDDPYTMPIIGIPPASDKANSTKWHPLADNPTEQMMKVKAELQQRVSSIFGVSGIFTGDVTAVKGNTNEAHQMTIMDRNLVRMRTHVDDLLSWIVHKYKGITDWDLKLIEPPDEQSMDEADKFNKQLINAKLAKDLGFDIISQADGIVEISATPKAYDPLKGLIESKDMTDAKGDGGEIEEGANKNHGNYKYSVSSADYLSKSKNNNDDMLMEVTKSKKTVSSEQIGRVLAEMVKSGVELQ